MPPPKLEENSDTSETHIISCYPSPPLTPRDSPLVTPAPPAQNFSGHISSEAIPQRNPPKFLKGTVSASLQSIKSLPPNNDSSATYPLGSASSTPVTFFKPSPSKGGISSKATPRPGSVVLTPFIKNHSVRSNNCPSKEAPSEPLSPRPAPNDSASSDHDACSLEDPGFKPLLILKKIIAVIRYSVILASSKEYRDSKARVTGVFNLIQSLHQGSLKINKELVKRTLTSKDYEQLLLLIAKDQSLQGFFDDKLRFDYTHHEDDRNEFMIRMPKEIHDGVAEHIGHFISLGLHNFIGGNYSADTIELSDKMVQLGSAEIKFPSRFSPERDTKSPEKQYRYEGSQYPGLVIEVAWSQEGKDLPGLAKRYIEASGGEIRTVIGVDIKYEKPIGPPRSPNQSASFWVWRAEHKKGNKVAASQPIETKFRDAGTAIAGADLRLQLTDFVSQSIADAYPNVTDDPIVIKSTDVCRVIEQTENFMRMNQEKSASRPVRRATEGARASLANIASKVKGPITRNMAKPRRSARLSKK